ncbi:MAG: DEAD/DEAH box helicase [Robiginitomaculum sp.]|nr:DEAD/DEAH box helicase [Robiginitomaculum sp.]
MTRPTDTADTIEQLLIKLDRNDARLKNEALRTIIDEHNVRNAIVFCNRKRDVDRVATFLKKSQIQRLAHSRGFATKCAHSHPGKI